ncbi:MAG: MFS transporter [Chloroflexi bacterium]|nr:MFS transporter [Chloroflexota bacterium]
MHNASRALRYLEQPWGGARAVGVERPVPRGWRSGASRSKRGLLLVASGVVACVAVLGMVLPAFANGDGHDHDAGAVSLAAGPALWGGLSLGIVFLLIVLSRLSFLRQVASREGAPQSSPGYWQTLRQFSRNARLFLAYSLMAELGTGIWSVLFNLYLLRSGFPITFIGTFWLVNMLFHGMAALPAGLISDRFGRRRSFFVATAISLVAQGSLLFASQPTVILVFAAVAGMGEAFHGVTGAPFMMENSEPGERPHLFSLNAAFLQVSRFSGSIAGGMLPLGMATVLGTPALAPSAARLALLAGLPMTLVALVPLAFMRERPVELVESFRELVTFRNVVNGGVVARLTLLGLMAGAGFGLTIRFFNVFFEEAHGALDSQIGTVMAFGALAGASSVLVSPLLAQRWGKVKSILVTQALSVPFLLLMAAVPAFSAVTVLFVVRGALYSLALPLRNQLSMELVTSRERGTTAGFTHTAFDLGGGLGAGAAGLLISTGGFLPAFVMAGVLILVPAVLYYLFFARMEAQASGRLGTVTTAATSA